MFWQKYFHSGYVFKVVIGGFCNCFYVAVKIQVRVQNDNEIPGLIHWFKWHGIKKSADFLSLGSKMIISVLSMLSRKKFLTYPLLNLFKHLFSCCHVGTPLGKVVCCLRRYGRRCYVAQLSEQDGACKCWTGGVWEWTPEGLHMSFLFTQIHNCPLTQSILCLNDEI